MRATLTVLFLMPLLSTSIESQCATAQQTSPSRLVRFLKARNENQLRLLFTPDVGIESKADLTARLKAFLKSNQISAADNQKAVCCEVRVKVVAKEPGNLFRLVFTLYDTRGNELATFREHLELPLPVTPSDAGKA